MSPGRFGGVRSNRGMPKLRAVVSPAVSGRTRLGGSSRQMRRAGAAEPIVLHVKPDWRGTATAVAGIVSVLLVAAGLFYTNQANRAEQQANRRQQDATLQGQAADRYTAAIDQLGTEGTDALSIRLGAIYALETLMKEHGSYRPTVVEVLAAFIRTHAVAPHKPPGVVARSTEDVRAALVVIGRRPHPERDAVWNIDGTLLGLAGLDLSRADLRGVSLLGTDLTSANLSGANLQDARLDDADMTDASLTGADLQHAQLNRVDLAGADMAGVNLSGADLARASLTHANLERAQMVFTSLGGADMAGVILSGANLSGAAPAHANLRDANLRGANLQGAWLEGSDLQSADLEHADLKGARLRAANLQYALLTGADLRDNQGMTQAQISTSVWDQTTRLPPGLTPN